MGPCCCTARTPWRTGVLTASTPGLALHVRALVPTGPAGGVITLPVSLGAGESCQAEYGGTFWTVRNYSDTSIPSGSRARIARVENLTLLVKPQK